MTGSLPLLPEALPRQLAPGGRLFVILGEGPIMQATLMTCIAPGSYRRTVLFETLVKSLQPCGPAGTVRVLGKAPIGG